MLNSDTFNKIEKQLEYSLYLVLTICLISLYISFSIYEKQRPLRDLNTLKNYVELYNQKNGSLISKTKSSEAKIFEDNLRNKINSAVQKQLNINIDWGLYSMSSSLNKLLLPITNNSIISNDETIYGALEKFNNEVSMNDFKNIYCTTNKLKDEEKDVRYFYNVNSLHIIDSVDKKILTIGILIGKSRENNSLSPGGQFNITCFCEIDTVVLKNKSISNWVKKELPWIFNHLDEIGNKKLKDFNQFWEGKLTDEVLKEEQSIVGLKFQNYSLTIITIVLLISIFTFHLSLLSELLRRKSELPSDFSIAVLYTNNWGALLRIFTWLIIPLFSILMTGYFISNSYLIMLWTIPVLILGAIILRKINKLISK